MKFGQEKIIMHEEKDPSREKCTVRAFWRVFVPDRAFSHGLPVRFLCCWKLKKTRSEPRPCVLCAKVVRFKPIPCVFAVTKLFWFSLI
jgi:hypothetical protein